MKKIRYNNWLFILVLFISFVFIGYFAYNGYIQYRNQAMERKTSSIHQRSNISEEKLMNLIATGKISDQTAMYWHKVTE